MLRKKSFRLLWETLKNVSLINNSRAFHALNNKNNVCKNKFARELKKYSNIDKAAGHQISIFCKKMKQTACLLGRLFLKHLKSSATRCSAENQYTKLCN